MWWRPSWLTGASLRAQRCHRGISQGLLQHGGLSGLAHRRGPVGGRRSRHERRAPRRRRPEAATATTTAAATLEATTAAMAAVVPHAAMAAVAAVIVRELVPEHLDKL